MIRPSSSQILLRGLKLFLKSVAPSNVLVQQALWPALLRMLLAWQPSETQVFRPSNFTFWAPKLPGEMLICFLSLPSMGRSSSK